MALYFIKISRTGGKIVVHPDLCVVDQADEPSYILIMLDESLQLSPQAKPGFDWGSITPPAFIGKPIPLAGGNIILIEDAHTNDASVGCWSYRPRIDDPKSGQTQGQTQGQTGTCTAGYMLNEKHPIIINR